MIRIPYQFDGDPHAEEKLFVVLCHVEFYAICIKATSKVTLFQNNPVKRMGCIWIPAGEVTCFPLPTVIDPDNQFPIPHDHIKKAHREGTLEIHELPRNFETDLRNAIANSATLAPRQRARLLSLL